MVIRPIDANALARRIREYMDDFPNATTRLATCRVILSMLGDENQTPTLTQPNEWVSVEESLPEAGKLIVYANNYGNEALYGVLRVPKNERPNRYDYWTYLSELPDRRPPEGENNVIEVTEDL